MISVEIVTKPAEKSLQNLAAAAGISMRQILWDVMRLALNNVLKFTPPFADGSPKKGNKPASKKAGEERVRKDYNKLFAPIDNPAALESWNDTLLNTAGDDIVTRTVRGKVRVRKKQLRAFSISKMRGHHDSNRDNRGRVRKQKNDPNLMAGGKTLVPRKDLAKAIKADQKRVGFLKAGWLPALSHFARLSKGRIVAPAWAKRHSAPGSFGDNLNKQGRGILQAKNDVPYGRNNKATDTGIDFAVKIAQKSLVGRAQAVVDRLVKQYNAGKI